MMKRWLLRRTENRIVLLFAAAILLGAWLFSAVVKHTAEGGRRAGAAGVVATRIAGVPQRLARAFLPDAPDAHPFAVYEERFAGMSGLEFAGDSFADEGYLLVNRYDGDRESWVVELLDLGRRTTVHAWQPPTVEYASTGPYALGDGSLLVAVERRSLAMLDACSAVEWRLDDRRFHHSVERDADGHFWVPYDVAEPTRGFREEGLARISRAGRILSLIPLYRSLASGGHRHLLYSLWHHLANPMHINDIEPVLEDGPSWRRGDLLVSLRSRSVVLLYRPSNDEIIWLKSGPWLHQHDVNIVGPGEISVFSNNAVRRSGQGFDVEVLGANEVYVYDPGSGAVRSPWRDALRQHDVRTPVVGRATVLGNGDVFVEESMHGRALRVSAAGSLRWTYVNRARTAGGGGEGSGAYRMTWSRYLEPEAGAAIAASVAAREC